MLEVLTPVVSAAATIYIVIGLLFLWAIFSFASLWNKSRRLISNLRSARLLLDQSPDAVAFVSRYEAVNIDLERDEVLGGRWRELRDTLVMPQKPGEFIRSTTRPSEWFNHGLLRAPRIDIDPRYHAAMPNLLVGAGLLFTFLGLAVALASAAGVVSGSASARNEALRTLLDTASFKFLTSLAGMFLSILYALGRKWRLHAVDRALDLFLAALERLIPLITPISLQQEQLKLMERQATHLESFSNDLAVSLGTAIDQTFNERLAEHIGPLTEAISRLSEKMASGNEDAMKTMLDAFLSKLDGGASDHMKGVAESLSGLGVRLEGFQDGLVDAAVRMAQSADAMAARMGEGAEAALTRITDQMGALVESLRAVSEQTRDAGSQATGAMADRIGAATASFERAAGQVSATLTDAAAAMGARMGEQANESSARLSTQLEAMVGELRGLAEASRAAGTEAFEELAKRVGDAATTFESTAAAVAGALEKAASDTGGVFGKGAEDAVARVAAATEGMRDEIRVVLAELRTSVSSAGEALQAGSVQSAAAMRGTLDEASRSLAVSLDQAASRLATAGGEAGSALERGGAGASERIVQAGGALGERAGTLAGQIATLTGAADGLAQRILAFEQAAGAAAEPLASSAGDLKAAGVAARSALEPLAQTTQTVARAIEQVAGVAQRLDQAVSSASRLLTSLDEASKRFEGVDRELAKTLAGLQSGLQGFTKQVTEFVGQTDSNLAKAATQLASLVKSLEDTLEDYAPSQNRRSGGG